MAVYDSFTKLLLHCDGTSNTFIDEIGKTITPAGNATQSTTQSKFGGKSAYFDGTGDYLTIPDSIDFNFNSTPFTIDLWVNWVGGLISPLLHTNNTSQYIGLYANYAGNVMFTTETLYLVLM